MIKYASNYVVEFVTIDGTTHKKEFRYHQSKVLSVPLRPHAENGINYIEDGRLVFIPWHQITKSSFSEEIIGEEPM